MSADDELAELLSGLSVKTQHCERCQVALPETQKPEGGLVLCNGCREQADEEKRRGIVWGKRTSTKLRKTLALLDEFRAQAKDDKTIIFSQFTSFLDLLEPALRAEGVEFVRCTWDADADDGTMTRVAREAALQAIRTRPETRVILISFKAGSTGLNLTCCNRVILCDLWWNPQIEEQAFDRAHRYVCVTDAGSAKPRTCTSTSCRSSTQSRSGFCSYKRRSVRSRRRHSMAARACLNVRERLTQHRGFRRTSCASCSGAVGYGERPPHSE